MNYANPEPKYPVPTNNALRVLGGMLIGALAGALTMLLLAPQSGKDTRRRIQEKGLELRDRTTGMVLDTMAQVRSKANKITLGLRDRSQELAVEQLDHIAEAAQTGKKAIQSLG
ncbi:MAG TPA: YtxH domain-containing protein [Anaerolineales bacterium]|nr:YtxH domain-containing protein [Anaerolineales bacterium]